MRPVRRRVQVGSHGAQHERLGGEDRLLALGTVVGHAAAGEAGVDERHGGVEVLHRERAGLDAGGQHVAEDLLDGGDVVAHPLPGPAGEHRAKVGTGGELVHAPQVDLLTDVRAQLVGGVGDLVDRCFDGRDVQVGLVRDEPEEQRLLVREVVVDGGPAHARSGGDVGEGDRVEATVGHQGGERAEQLQSRLFAVLMQRTTDDLGHGDSLTPSVSMSPGRRSLAFAG
ncbi:hypothetical protein GALL_306810 [mine drainage metagenome]|uniref:Uncharacterized protein n=1 Tax=mine drainage metagenome TaxID=410659 RepID=A0A1J5RCT8_9ZZZZ